MTLNYYHYFKETTYCIINAKIVKKTNRITNQIILTNFRGRTQICTNEIYYLIYKPIDMISRCSKEGVTHMHTFVNDMYKLILRHSIYVIRQMKICNI